jgi:hypothetical protein
VVEVVEVVDVDAGAGVVGGDVSGSRIGVVDGIGREVVDDRSSVDTESPPPDRATKTITPAIKTTAAATPNPIRYLG